MINTSMTTDDLFDMVTELRREVDRLNKEVFNLAPSSSRRFRPPTVEQVAERMAQRNLTGFSAEAFHAFYESNGWMVGKNKMKSWDAALTTWAQRDHVQLRQPYNKAIKFYTYNEICQMALTSNTVWQEYVALRMPDRPKAVWAHVNDATMNDLMKYKV